MLRHINKCLLAILLIPSLAFAESAPIRNDNDANLRDLGSNLQVGRNFSVDQAGRTKVVLSAGVAAATNPAVLEDVAVVTGQALMMSGAVNNRSQTIFNSTGGDATPFGVGDYGELTITMSPSAQTFANSAIQAEDAAFGAASGVVMSGAQAVSAIAQTVGTSGDVAPPSMDLGNRLVTTMAPAGETWQSCGTATASTADIAIKAAVASNRIYVTSITCSNSSATTQTQIQFKDGATVMAYGGVTPITATLNGMYTMTFPVPLRGTSNTAFNFATITSVSSVFCCGAGYISTI